MADAADFDPEAILRALVGRGVRFVLIGGLAAAVQGAPLATTDVDITPSSDAANLERLSGALRDLHARVSAPDAPQGLPFDHDAASLGAAVVWNLVTDHGSLDIALRPAGTEGYDDLAARAVTLDLGVPVAVAALRDVIRSKRAAGRPRDLAVLRVLEQTLDELEG